MPVYLDGPDQLEVNREATLLDSGVLIAAFSRAEQGTDIAERASFFLDNPDVFGASNQWLVPSEVVVEAWGFVASKHKDTAGALRMLRWLVLNADVLRFASAPAEGIDELAREQGVDVVDAYVFRLASAVTGACGLTPPLRVATLDTRDFTRLWAADGFPLRIFDVEHLDHQLY